jgi:hypothetical protein
MLLRANCLFSILEKLADENPVISHAALVTLQRISTCCNYSSGNSDSQSEASSSEEQGNTAHGKQADFAC